ncbi:MAG TPA: TetR/AcrR family transcriptional regulator [Bryobacteraceae bacterium]|jgi:AcrR family transcriptional regulator
MHYVDIVNIICQNFFLYHHGNLRAALIEAGLELIAEKGPLALTLREIGARLGVSRTAAYRHFADKTALLNAISEAGFIEFGKALEQAREQAGSKFAARLAAMGMAYLRFAREHSAHFQVMFGPGAAPLDPSCDTAGSRAFNILLDTVKQGQEQGEVRPGDPMLTASVAWAMIHGVSVLHLDELRPLEAPGTHFAQACAEILLTGMRR